jgi:hypothetical protein
MASKTISWRGLGRYVGEAVAIFVGVAAALAGQAWFEDRAERGAEREFLQTVIEELATIDLAADSSISFAEENESNGLRLAWLLSPPMTAARSDSVAKLAPLLSNYDLATGYEAVDVLLGPENLRLVRDADLRAVLAAFRVTVAAQRGVIRQHAGLVLNEYRDLGLDLFDYRVEGGLWGTQPDLPPASRHRRDGTRLVALPRFENIVDLLIALSRQIVVRSESTKAEIPEVRALVNARLAAL